MNLYWTNSDSTRHLPKITKALGRGEVSDAYKLDQHRPKYTLNHIIKERYPTFADALRDLDDPLNMLFLLLTCLQQTRFLPKLFLKLKSCAING